MRVLRADALGMCFGVRDALAIIRSIDDPTEVTIHGELVHNPEINAQLRDRGFLQVSEAQRDVLPTPPTPAVLITAHGTSDAERRRLASEGKRLIDTTCPLVERAHRAARALQAQGYFVVVIGKPGHVEVRGLVGDLHSYAVVDSPADARPYHQPRLGIICQTTTPPPHAAAIHEAIIRANPDAREIRFVDTVCRPTKERQRALERLLEQVEAVVVVGGRNSNNTRALLERCRQAHVAAWQVERPSDLVPGNFAGIRVVGLTAGTSTPDETVDAVHARLEEIARLLELDDCPVQPPAFAAGLEIAREGSA
jgi:4-hydroxy-3-methylbut-2-enyl diphosphate reductase